MNRCKNRRFLNPVRRVTAALAVFLMLFVIPPGAAAHDTSKPLSLQNLEDLLNGKVPPRRVGQIAQERGIEFALTPEIESHLRDVLRRNGVEGAAAEDLLGRLRKVTPKAAPESQAAAAPGEAKATLVVVADLACTWKLDGQDKGELAVDAPVKVPVDFGKHTVEAITLDGLDHWQIVVDASKPQEEIVATELLAVRAIRESASKAGEQPAAAPVAPSPKAETDYFTDHAAGLMWAAKDNGEDVDLSEAADYCHGLKLGGFTDWRLPNIEELQRVYEHYAGLHDLQGWHWSTTQKDATKTWCFIFGSGRRFVSGNDASLDGHALCVRRATP
jgi:Protein of unknown function (DUF1566)